MIALIQAETTRLLSRRITLFFPLVLAVLMIAGVILGIVLVSTAGDSSGPNFVDDIVAAQSFNESGGLEPEEGTDVLFPMGLLIPIMAFVVGASFYGADEKVGMIEHLLTWEPRRWRLLMARAVGGATSLFVISALLSTLLVVLLFILSAATGGDTSGVGDVAGLIVGAIIRSGLSGAFFFLIGFGLTVLINSSIASIVGFLIWVFVVEIALVSSLLPKWSQWFPVSNAGSFVSGSDFEVFPGPFDDQSSFGVLLSYSSTEAGIRILVWAVALFGLGTATFTRRDID